MAKKKRRAGKKTASNRRISKVTAKKKKSKVSLGKSKGNARIDPNQKQLPGIEDDRFTAVERVIKQLVDKKSQRARLKEDVDALVEKLPPLFHKHKLRQYSCYGKTVIVEAGADVVKIKKATSK